MRRLALSAVLMSLVILPAAGGDAYAATCTFKQGSDLWHLASNWDCNAIPGAGDEAVIPAGAAPSVTQNEAPGSLTLSGGQIAFFGAPAITVSGAANVTSGTLAGDGTLAVAASGSFAKSGAGQLTISDGAKLQLGADWSQTLGTIFVATTGQITGGTTGTVSGGVLTVSGSLAGSLTLTGGSLGGIGQITGAVTNTSGTVRPAGSSARGTLSITGSYAQGAAATIEIEENGTVPGTGFDVLAIAGPATLFGTVSVIHAPGYTPLITDQFRFLTTTSSVVNVNTPVNPPTMPVGGSYQVDNTLTGPRLLLHTPFPTAPGDPLPSISIPEALGLGVVLTCDSGGAWSNNPTLTYEWLREGFPIDGATAKTYALALADAKHNIACRITGTSTGDPYTFVTASVPAPGVKPFNKIGRASCRERV